MADYQQLNDAMTGALSETVLRRADSAYIPNDGGNRDRQTYEQWLSEGNTPDPPDPLPEPVPPPPDPNARLDTGVQAAVDTWHTNTIPGARAGGAGGMSTEERLIRLEATVQAWASGQMQNTKALAF